MNKYFSLFSGIGGFDLGIKQALNDSECVGYSEINKYAIAIYTRHFRNVENFGDATKIKTKRIPDFELLVAGFPCQSFSVAGKHEGLQDERGNLFFEIIRILRDKRPRYFLLENVKGLLSNQQGKTFQTILKVLTNIGYILQYEVLNSCNYGVPQNRERLYIVGHIAGECRPEIFPIEEKYKMSNENDIEWISGGSGISYGITATYGLGPSKRSRTLIQLNKGKSQGQRVYDINGLSTTISQKTDGQGRSTGLYKDNGIRRLTPIECERLQGFPDNWTKYGYNKQNDEIVLISDTQRYCCIGNAVTVPIIKYIISKLYKGD